MPAVDVQDDQGQQADRQIQPLKQHSDALGSA